MQKLPLGAKESDIILPDILEVEVEEADETLAEDSQNVHLVKAVDKGTEKDTDAETAVWQISGITWKLDEEQSDLPEFHGGISEKTISKNLTRTESRSRLRRRPGRAMRRQIRTTTAVPMSTHRFCRRNIRWERKQSFRKSAFS